MYQQTSHRPRLSINRAWAWYVGPVHQNRPHEHRAHQITWSLEEDLSAISPAGAIHGAGHVVCSGAVHQVECTSWLQTIYLLPEMLGSQCLVARANGSIAALTLSEAKQMSAIMNEWINAQPFCNNSALLPDSTTDASRLGIVLMHLEQNLDRPLRAEAIAALVHLSPSRFLHWFTQTLGLPFRPYVRWLRLQAAVRSLASGSNLTVAAHHAGFADSAHLSRSFVSAFGVTPNSLADVEVTLSDMEFPMERFIDALGAARAAKAHLNA